MSDDKIVVSGYWDSDIEAHCTHPRRAKAGETYPYPMAVGQCLVCGQLPDESEIVQLKEVLRDLIDPDPCWYDHHGYCQAHLWLTDESECPHARAKRLLGESE